MHRGCCIFSGSDALGRSVMHLGEACFTGGECCIYCPRDGVHFMQRGKKLVQSGWRVLQSFLRLFTTTVNLVPHGTLGHIKPERFFAANRIPLHTNQLNAANAGVLSRIFRKSFCFAEVVLSGWIMRLQDVHHIVRSIAPDDQEIRICRFRLAADLIGDTSCDFRVQTDFAESSLSAVLSSFTAPFSSFPEIIMLPSAISFTPAILPRKRKNRAPKQP